MNEDSQRDGGYERESAKAEDAASPDTTEIRATIARTRHEMSGTLDELQGKLEPTALKDEAVEQMQDAKAAVREAMVGRVQRAAHGARDALKHGSGSLIETLRRNPIPAVMAGIGLTGVTWLLIRARRGRREVQRSQ